MSVNSDLGPRRRTRRVELGTSNALSDDQVLIRLGKKPVLKVFLGPKHLLALKLKQHSAVSVLSPCLASPARS